MTPQPTAVQSPDAGAIIVNDPDAFAIFLERVRPVIEFLEAEKNKLPPQLCALLDSDTESDLTPSEVTQLLKQTDISPEVLADVSALAEEAERSMKWEQDCKAFLAQVMAAAAAAKAKTA